MPGTLKVLTQLIRKVHTGWKHAYTLFIIQITVYFKDGIAPNALTSKKENELCVPAASPLSLFYSLRRKFLSILKYSENVLVTYHV